MIKYVLLVLGGAISFGILTSFVKLAYKEGYHPAEISFIQASIGAIVLWGTACFSENRNVKAKQIPALLFTGASIGISTYLYYLSVQYIPASVAIVLLMQFTWISILIEWFIYKKRPSVLEIIITAAILFGTLLASGSTSKKGIELPILGIVYVLFAALIYAIYIVSNSRNSKEIGWQYKSAWIMTGSSISIFLVNLNTLVYHSHIETGLFKWGVFLALFGTILPPVFFAVGMPKVGASRSGLLMTVELPMAILSAHLILKENITLVQLAGIAIMLSAIIWMNLAQTKEPKKIMS